MAILLALGAAFWRCTIAPILAIRVLRAYELALRDTSSTEPDLTPPFDVILNRKNAAHDEDIECLGLTPRNRTRLERMAESSIG